MSLFGLTGTRSAPSSAPPPCLCPYKNVLFTLDRMSLSAIIDGMKGLNCLGLFGSHGGLSQSSITSECVKVFVGPVTSSTSRFLLFPKLLAGAFRPVFPTFLPGAEAPAAGFSFARFTFGGCPFVCLNPLYELLQVIRRLIFLCLGHRLRTLSGSGYGFFGPPPRRPPCCFALLIFPSAGVIAGRCFRAYLHIEASAVAFVPAYSKRGGCILVALFPLYELLPAIRRFYFLSC